MISVDSNHLNYNTFMPGKLLGSTLSVGNKTDYEQIVELSVDAQTLSYSRNMLSQEWGDAELPFELQPT